MSNDYQLDIFGYGRSKVGQHVYSSDYASICFANNASPFGAFDPSLQIGLTQGASLAYQHRVEPKFEGGSHELYWMTGQSMGSLSLQRLVGDHGILNGIPRAQILNGRPSLLNGVLGAVEFKVGRQGTEASVNGVTLGQTMVVLRGCVLNSYGLNYSVGGYDVQETLNISVAMAHYASDSV